MLISAIIPTYQNAKAPVNISNFSSNEVTSRQSSKIVSPHFCGDEKKESCFGTPDEILASMTVQEKKHQHGWSKILRFTDAKPDLLIVILSGISLLFPPLQLISMPLFVGRSIIRYIQGRRTPVEKIDAFLKAKWAGENPNIYKY